MGSCFSNAIYLRSLEDTLTSETYQKFLKQKFFPHAMKKGIIENHYFIQGGASPYRTHDFFQLICKVYGHRVIGL